jgi:D-aspartate ligase
VTQPEVLPAIILGGGPIAVPVARSLNRTGVPVIALGVPDDPVRASRHCTLFRDLGAYEGVQERWLEWLTDAQSPRGVLLPCNDDALELVARHRAVLERSGHRPMEAVDDVVLALLDKQRTYELARELGIPAPRTVTPGADFDLDEVIGDLTFPLALKPRQSHLFARHFGGARKLMVVHNRRELIERYAELRSLQLEILITELIPGPDHAHHSFYSFIDGQGEPLVKFTKHKLRQFPPSFGLTTYHEVDRDHEVMALGLRFFRGIGLRGPACVEFKKDSRDGRLVLIECNPRFTSGHELVRHSGIDLALLAYNHVTGRGAQPLDDYRVGGRMWHPVEDTRTFLELRRRGEITSRRWLRSVMHRQHFPIFSWKDPGPSLLAWSYLAWRALTGRRRRQLDRAGRRAGG